MSKIDYKLWAKYINILSKNIVKKNFYLLELSGGTGKLASILYNKSKKYVLCDLSKEMLIQSKTTIIPRVCCSNLSLPFKRKFNLIIMTFDSINYFLTKKQLLQFFSQIFNILENDGIFLFDASMLQNSINSLKKLNRNGIIDKISYIQKSNFNIKTKIHTNKFLIRNGNKYFKEIHKQKIYSLTDFLDILDHSGLYASHCYEAFSFQKASENSERVQFVVRKKNVNF